MSFAFQILSYFSEIFSCIFLFGSFALIGIDKQDHGICLAMHATHSIGISSQLGGKTNVPHLVKQFFYINLSVLQSYCCR
jgi:hypothetical protein